MITELIDEMEELLEATRVDVEKFELKGNALAGKRIRKAMQDIKTNAQKVRFAISEIKAQNKK